MSTAIQRQFRKGTAAQIAGVVLAAGEPAWATDTKQLFIGDGVTSGGNLVAMEPSVGTFTPALTFNGAAVGMTYAVQAGHYTKIADRVLFDLTIVLTAKGSSTGAAAIGGLPFTSNAGSGRNYDIGIYTANMASLSGGIVALLQNNSSSITPAETQTGTTNGLADTNFTNGSQIIMSGQYAV